MVPATALPITGVLGLDSLHKSRPSTPRPRRPMRHGRHRQGRGDRQGTAAGWLQRARRVCTGLTRPEDLWSAYDQPDDNRGAGQKIAIFGEGSVDETIGSLRDFEKFNRFRHVNIGLRSVADDFTSEDGTDEWQLDTQSSTGMAPDLAEEDLYFGDNLTDASTLAVVQAWTGDANAPLQAIGVLWRVRGQPRCSDNTSVAPVTNDQAGVTYEGKYETTLMMAAAEGRTLFTSAGDTGGGCAETSAPVNGVGEEPVPLAPYPAGSAYAVGVGGTILSTDHDTSTDTDPSSLDTTKGDGAMRSTIGEVGWEYTGGGSSKFVAMPANNYQSGNLLAPFPSRSASPPQTARTGNTGKDPANRSPTSRPSQATSATMNGYALSAGGSDNSQGAGTSLSSPLSVGMWARIQAAAPADKNGNFTGLGFANYDFYKHEGRLPRHHGRYDGNHRGDARL